MRRSVFLAVVIGLLPAGRSHAGNMDTHMSATYVLARQAGMSKEDASLVARADWSMDLNEVTVATPKSPINDSVPSGKYSQRGAGFHSLGTDPEKIRERLEELRGAIAVQARVSHEAELRATGQYLHALQDVYFHQKEGAPYDEEKGHVWGWHRADKVGLHYDAALRACDVTARVLQAVAVKAELPPIPPAKELYRFDRDTGMQVTRDELRRITDGDRGPGATGAVRVAAAIYGAYPKKSAVGTIGDVDPKQMNAALEKVWKGLGHADALEPLPPMDERSRGKLDYDQHPDLLSLPPKTIATQPGGIALSRAVATRMPIDLDLDSIRFEDGAVLLSGKARNGRVSRFDAPLFMTALRLACERGDPMFSLDPADGTAWSDDAAAAMREAVAALAPRLDARAGAPDPEELQNGLAAGGSYLHGPVILAASVRAADPALWREIQARHPHLGSRLVFRPEWLRATRLGQILFEADLLLKELASGMSLAHPGARAAARDIEGYRSADEERAARATMESLRGKKEAAATGARLWFELPHPEPLSMFNLPSLPPGLFAPGGLLARAPEPGLLGVVEDRLRADGYLGDAVDASLYQVRIPSSDGTLDLSEVWPRVFVRAHDPAKNQDVAGSEAALDALAARVNAKLPAYADRYPSLGRLVAVLRAYVAATRIAAKHEALCDDLVPLPLFPAERVAEPLPESVEGDLVVAVAKLSLYRSLVEKEDGLAMASSYNGGVSLAGRSIGERAFVEEPTDVTREVAAQAAGWRARSAPWGGHGRRNLALTVDIPEMAASARAVDDGFQPVTMEDVDAMMRGAPTARVGSSSRFGERIAASRWTSLAVTFVLVLATWLIVVRRRSRALRLWATLAILPALLVGFLVVDAIRDETLYRVVDRGWPALKPGATARILSMQFERTTLEWRGWSRPNGIEIERQWSVSLPARAVAKFDPSCGRSCDSAIRVDGLRCSAALLSFYTGSTDCRWHLWRYADGSTRCFLELQDPLPQATMILDPLQGRQSAPRELPLDQCPIEMRWMSDR